MLISNWDELDKCEIAKSVEEVIEEVDNLHLSDLQIDYIEDGNYPRIILEDVK